MSGVHRTQLLPEVQRVGMISRMRSRPGLHPSEGAVPRNFGATARGHANDEPRRLKLNLSTSASFLEVRQEAAKSRSTRGAPGIPTLCCLSGLEGSAYCSNPAAGWEQPCHELWALGLRANSSRPKGTACLRGANRQGLWQVPGLTADNSIFQLMRPPLGR
jgi:hypothetical protein